MPANGLRILMRRISTEFRKAGPILGEEARFDDDRKLGDDDLLCFNVGVEVDMVD